METRNSPRTFGVGRGCMCNETYTYSSGYVAREMRATVLANVKLASGTSSMGVARLPNDRVLVGSSCRTSRAGGPPTSIDPLLQRRG